MSALWAWQRLNHARRRRERSRGVVLRKEANAVVAWEIASAVSLRVRSGRVPIFSFEAGSRIVSTVQKEMERIVMEGTDL